MEDDVALKLVHTADWHLGKRFRSFEKDQERTLTRERLAVVERVLRLAKHHQANAVLCAGDLFDSPQPEEEWWCGLVQHLERHGRPECPIFLLPGNHDPIKPGSVYGSEHAFRRALPAWVHVVDRSDFSYELSKDAVLHAVPCLSQAGQDDPTKSLPRRADGDQRLRIGLVHGPTMALEGTQPNFLVSKTAAHELGFDYLALGDTHSFTEVETGTPVPVVYPGSPEVTNFPNWEDDRLSEQNKGEVALVFLRRHPHPPLVRRETVGRFRWVAAHCDSMESIRSLKSRSALEETVLKVELDLAVTLKEEAELEQILRELVGDEAMAGRAAVVQVERKRVELTTGDLDELLPRLPGVLRATVQRLREQAANDTEDAVLATRALRHLYQVVRKEVAL
ncbi:MAG TPA: DNA repair exonuclease [Polyangiaceae bacterium]